VVKLKKTPENLDFGGKTKRNPEESQPSCGKTKYNTQENQLSWGKTKSAHLVLPNLVFSQESCSPLIILSPKLTYFSCYTKIKKEKKDIHRGRVRRRDDVRKWGSLEVYL